MGQLSKELVCVIVRLVSVGMFDINNAKQTLE